MVAFLTRSGVGMDPITLMSLVDAAGAGAGKYTVDVRGAQGVQIGDHNRQDNVFRAPPGG